MTAITVYELWFGVTRSRKSIGEEALLGLMTVLPLNEGTAKRAASLHADLIRCNQDIGVKDVLNCRHLYGTCRAVEEDCAETDTPTDSANPVETSLTGHSTGAVAHPST